MVSQSGWCKTELEKKTFLRENAIPVGRFHIINNEQDITNITEDLFPGILKIAEFGYDGKGQKSVDCKTSLTKAFDEFQKTLHT